MFSWRKFWKRRIEEAQERLTMSASQFGDKYGQILEGPTPWAPGEPAQSILRTLKKQRHRFVFSHTQKAGQHYWAHWYSACDKETGRVLWFHSECFRYRGITLAASPGLTGEEARWVYEQYLAHIASAKARAARIDNARERVKLMQEYVK